jgi:hypothetical protein
MELIHNVATLAAVTRGQSASKTRVNALSFPRVPIVGHGASLIGIAGTSPAMTPSVWLEMSGKGIKEAWQ